MKPESLLQRLALPPEFGVALLLFGFTLAIAPYFSGADFGAVKIPELSIKSRRYLRAIGPLALAAAILLHVPFAQKAPASMTLTTTTSTTGTTSTTTSANVTAVTITATTPPVATSASVEPPRPTPGPPKPLQSAPRVHRVNLIVDHAMSKARVLLDDREPTILLRTSNVIAIEVPAHAGNHVIRLESEGREPCVTRITITENTTLTPCP
jgi:hypothetical protein